MNEELLARMDACYSALQNATTTYARKQWFELMKEMLLQNEWLRNFWELCENAYRWADRIVRKGVQAVKRLIQPSAFIMWNNIQPMDKGTQQLYLVRLLNEDKQLIYSKVGTTTRETEKRMKEHLTYYKNEGVRYVEVVRLWDCGTTDAEAYESIFRANYIFKYPGTFRKNDRFINVEFDLGEADKLFQNAKTAVMGA